MRFLSSSSFTRSHVTFLMRAKECVDEVFIPTCQPQSDTTGYPSFSIAIAISAIDICSPQASSISISRLEALGLISSALAIKSSVVSPCAERTTHISFPLA